MIIPALLLLQATTLIEDPAFAAAHAAWAQCTNRAADAETGSARSDSAVAAAAQASCAGEEDAVRRAVIAHSGGSDGPGLMRTLLDADRAAIAERVAELRRRAAAQAQAGDGMRPEVEAAFSRARLAWLHCLRRQADGAMRIGRRANREAALDAVFLACRGDENAMRAALRRQYNQPAVDSLIASIGAAIRSSLRTYMR